VKRYLRQIILPEIGKRGQEFLLNSKVLIIGAGGLGHPAALYLSAMGIGQIGIMDGDVVDITNLHRQVLFDSKDVGSNKSEVLAQKISLQNQDIQVVSYNKFLTKQLGKSLFSDYDVVIDATDNFASKYLINDLCLLFKKPLVYGAISQYEGQISSFFAPISACYRCLFPKIPQSKIQNCAQSGVVGPLPGIIGTQTVCCGFSGRRTRVRKAI
jgi:adenylyltransferase/sulfurtransferase